MPKVHTKVPVFDCIPEFNRFSGDDYGFVFDLILI